MCLLFIYPLEYLLEINEINDILLMDKPLGFKPKSVYFILFYFY